MTHPSREVVARGSLSLMWLWLAATSFSDVGDGIVSGHIADHVLLGAWAASIPPAVSSGLVGVAQLLASVTLILPKRFASVRRRGAWLSAGLATVALTLLLTNPVWMDSLGGFPAIGSGQGLLKYAAVVGLSVYLAGVAGDDERLQAKGLGLAVAGLILPLLWIGAMKFTRPEAQGIEGLLASSPFFSWMGAVFSVQGASNVIGVTELVTAALLATYWLRPAWAAVGGALGVGTFLATLSFLVTAPGWHPTTGFPLLGGTGVFLVKDLALLATSLVVVSSWRQGRDGHGASAALGR